MIDFPGGSDNEESACNTADPGSIPRSGRSPPAFRLDNPMDRGAWWATVHGVAESRTRLSS